VAFGSIDVTTVARTQDYSTLKHNEDTKGLHDQMNISQQIHKTNDQHAHAVYESDNVDWHNKQPDAKEKGNNSYEGDGGKQRKKKETKEQVVVNGHQGFDIKI
jgi:hypothetical protein